MGSILQIIDIRDSDQREIIFLPKTGSNFLNSYIVFHSTVVLGRIKDGTEVLVITWVLPAPHTHEERNDKSRASLEYRMTIIMWG